MVSAPDLTVDTSANPFVEVFFDPADLDPAAATLRMYRYSDKRTWLVRGGVDVATGIAALDFECPFQSAASYRAEMFDVAGASLGFTDTATVTLDVSDVWVHNPLVPSGGISLGSFAMLGERLATKRPTMGQVVYTEGSVEGTLIGSRRRGIADLPIGFAVDSLEQADAVQSMLGDYSTQQLGVLCIRTPPGLRIPRTLFAAVGDPEEVAVDTGWGGSRSNFVFTATEVKAPFPGLVTPLLTYDDLDVAYSGYGVRDAAYSTYTEQDRDYSLAGLAG